MTREHDTRIWRVIEHHVHTARAGLDFSEVTEVGMDETSARRGQDLLGSKTQTRAVSCSFACNVRPTIETDRAA
jgi:hypothetical protein